jgi:hypothetical protein
VPPKAKTDYERFAPPHDDRLAGLLQAAHADAVPLYWAAVPIRYVRPFSATFKPDDKLWREGLEAEKARVKANDYPWMLVYQSGDFFVMSDDYPVYYAYLEANSEYAPCYILGEPRGTNAREARIASDAEVGAVVRGETPQRPPP